MSQVRGVLLLAVLPTLLLVPVLSDCSHTGPADCDFNNADDRSCGWGVGAGWQFGKYVNWCSICTHRLEFKNATVGRVQSTATCPTGTDPYCLRFKYWFEKGDLVDLNVIIKGSETDERVVWTASSCSSSVWWDVACASIQASETFTVIIEAKTRDGQISSEEVLVEDITYEPPDRCESCPKVVIPTTTTSATITTSAVSTKPTQPPTSQTTPTAALTEPLRTTSSDQGGPRRQGDVIKIVGAVIGVVIVVILVVVLLVVFRRKLPCSVCHKADEQGRQPPDVLVSYSPDPEDQGSLTDAGQPSRPQDSASSPPSSDGDRCVVDTTAKESAQPPPDQLYAAVNKPRRPNPGLVTGATDDSPDGMADDKAASTARRSAGVTATGLHHVLEQDPEVPQPHCSPDTRLPSDTLDADKLSPPQQLYDLPPGKGTTTPGQPSGKAQGSPQHFRTSRDDDGDYNSLDLGGRRRVVERGEGEGPGQVYSGLNEGDGDTYSEVNHHGRREVVDDQYSRFQ